MAHASELKNREVARWLSDTDTHATVLLALLLDEYGTECLQWDPETIRLQLEADYHVKLSQVNMDKIMALITALTTNMFYASVEAFTQISNALNNSQADFEVWDPPTAAEAAWAITEVTLNDPPRRKEDYANSFSMDVRRYLGVILEQESILNPPDVLKIAELDQQAAKNAELTFADDPSLFAGFHRLSEDKSQAIVQYVRDNIKKLMLQLDSLPLQNRDASQWQKFMKQHSY